MRNESNTVYAGVGDGWFEDRTAASGLAASSLAFTGFGTAWFDLDNDGWLDLYIANGGVMREAEPLPGENDFPYLQTDQLYLHNGRAGSAARFSDASARAGQALKQRGVTRGAAFADFDNDGRIDILLGQIHGPVRLLHNRAAPQAHWLGVALVDAKRVLQTGAVVERIVKEAGPVIRRARRDGSYASANDPRLIFGLGADAEPQVLQVRWPDGVGERFSGLAVDRYHRLERGAGQKADQ